MGIQLRPKKGHSLPQFSAQVYCGQTIAHLSYCRALVIFPKVHSIILMSVTQQTSTDGSALVEKVKDITTFLMMDPENWPQSFSFPLSFMLISFS